MKAITIHGGFTLALTTFSQNLHHLCPKGKCTTLARNRSHNGHPLLFPSWHPGRLPAPAFLTDQASFPVADSARPSSKWLLGLCREPSMQAALGALLLSLVSGEPNVLPSPLRSPLPTPLLPSTLCSSQGLTVWFGPEWPGSPTSTPQHEAKSVGPAPHASSLHAAAY